MAGDHGHGKLIAGSDRALNRELSATQAQPAHFEGHRIGSARREGEVQRTAGTALRHRDGRVAADHTYLHRALGVQAGWDSHGHVTTELIRPHA